jgi:hypothetical protein
MGVGPSLNLDSFYLIDWCLNMHAVLAAATSSKGSSSGYI